jgi:hypothetical protein
VPVDVFVQISSAAAHSGDDTRRLNPSTVCFARAVSAICLAVGERHRDRQRKNSLQLSIDGKIRASNPIR